MSWIDGVRARFTLLFRRGAAESRMNDEIRFHIEQETDRIVRDEGVDRTEARRRALAAFGGVENHKEELRYDRGGSWLAGLALDVKLGARMLAKYPGLTVVGVLGLAIGVAIGATGFAALETVVDSRLPFVHGDRVIALQNLGFRGRDGARANLHDLDEWRKTLRGVELLGAYRTLDRNLITADGAATPRRVAEMSATGFAIAGVTPMLGRYLLADDERPNAPPVVVIGFNVWQSVFLSDSSVVGKALRLGDTQHTIVGVMPRGFGFPINNNVWTPLKLNAADYVRGQAPAVEVFARLTPGTTLDEVHAQVEAMAVRLARAYPSERENIASRAMWYPHSFVEVPLNNPIMQVAINLVRVIMSVILIVIGVNVAILVYARTATRTGEIAVRTALGASRRRIVSQFFVEALVLSSVGAVVGLGLAQVALRFIATLVDRAAGEQLPFWIQLRLSPATVLYVAGLAVLAAVIVGVIPALKATQRQITATLKQLGAGAGLRLGKVWNTLIVAQVAATVAVMPVAVYALASWILMRNPTPSIPMNELLTASLYLGQRGAGTDDFDEYSAAQFRARFGVLQAEVSRALLQDPSVVSVTFSGSPPGREPQERIELDTLRGVAQRDSGMALRGRWTIMGYVAAGHFNALDVKPLAGRLFEPGDAAPGVHVAIVNRSFVRREFGDASALGRRIRPVGRNVERVYAPWYEIVGVVPDMPYVPVDSGRSRVYVPLRAADAHPITMTLRIRGGAPSAFIPRLREITTNVNPMLLLGNVSQLDQLLDVEGELAKAVLVATAIVAVSVLLLSGAGIYALIAFTVTRRRREIGIRTALGARSAQVIRGVLARAAAQIALGVAIGLVLALPVDRMIGAHIFAGWGVVILPSVVLMMAATGLMAAAAPVRKAMLIQPTEALRSE
ncbi:MAG TPA: ABC transporter permease [Gemmatimonadaceae bacterium]|nr:ABC transporter permease [Gemmatimonadaceae bacterium]